jgi:hypothetical protein
MLRADIVDITACEDAHAHGYGAGAHSAPSATLASARGPWAGAAAASPAAAAQKNQPLRGAAKTQTPAGITVGSAAASERARVAAASASWIRPKTKVATPGQVRPPTGVSALSPIWGRTPSQLTKPPASLAELAAAHRNHRFLQDSAKHEQKVRSCDDARAGAGSPVFSPSARQAMGRTPTGGRPSVLSRSSTPSAGGPVEVPASEDEPVAISHADYAKALAKLSATVKVEPAAANDEFATRKSYVEAIAVMKEIPRSLFASIGSGDSRLPMSEEDIDSEVLDRLKRLGGKNGESNTHLRILLVDMGEFMSEMNGAPTPALPIAAVDAEKFRTWLQSKDKKQTAADRISRVLEYAAKVGLPVCEKTALLAGPATKRLSGGAKGAKARDAPTPWMVVELERACADLSETAKFKHEPALDYCRHAFTLLKTGNRHAGYADASWKGAPAEHPGCHLLEVHEDKMRRQKVPLYIPMGGYTQLECSWEEEWIGKYTGAPALYLEWIGLETPTNPAYGKTSVINGASFAEPSTPCHPDKASKALCHVMEQVAERSHEEMMEENLSGVHIFRHVGAVTTILADWPEPEGNVVGDWSTQKKRAEGAHASKRARGVASSTRGTYAPDVCAAKQLAIRNRYLAMMRAAFAVVREGLDEGAEFPRDITWEELLPPYPPPSLSPFYGALYLSW